MRAGGTDRDRGGWLWWMTDGTASRGRREAGGAAAVLGLCVGEAGRVKATAREDSGF